MAFGLIIQRRSQAPSGRWPECSGMGGRNGSEYPAGINRNRWPESIGISGRNASEYAMISKNEATILIIEDEESMREALRDWLTEGGYPVKTAKDGEGGLKIISDHDIALVLLDLRLPGRDGISVLKEAKTIRPQLKVIIITAYPSPQTKEAALKEGAVDYLPKPFDLNDLDKLIRGTLLPAAVKGEAIAMLSVVKDEEGLKFALTGWEYIDAYLDSGVKDGKLKK